MSGTNDDEAWRDIVENYGDRPRAEELPPSVVESRPEPSAPTHDAGGEEPVERFVPPDPGPTPRLVLPLHLPWLGVFGVPVLLLVLLLAGVNLPSWLGFLLVASFVGSFVYLVATMKPGGRDPWDDGSRV